MSVLNSNPFLIASGSPNDPAVPLQRSVRLRSSASAYFNRTQTTPTNSVKCTFSGWVKRGTLGTIQVVFGGYTGTDADTQLYFDTTNQLKFTSRITNVNGAAFEWVGESAAVFRDPSAWYHIVVTVDTSTAQSTNNAYYTVYVNNVAQTFTTVSGASLVTAATVQNRNTCWNVSGYSATLGRQRTNYFDGYLTEINFIDGQALTPSSFGGYNAGTNVWEVRKYSGTYGTNGFYLPFTLDTTSTYAGSFNGTAKYISAPNNAVFAQQSATNWTVEGWVYSNSATLQQLFVYGNSTISTGNDVAFGLAYTPGSTATLFQYNGTTNTFVTSTLNVPLGQWCHIAAVNNGGTVTIYINGVACGTCAAVNTNSSGTFTFYVGNYGSSRYINGQVSNFRLVKGTAVYTSNFVPSTTPLTAITNTALLTLQNATIVDNSTNAFTLTNTGSLTTIAATPYVANVTSDASGNKNNWIPNNINASVSGVTYDSMLDVPTNTGSNNANFAVLNPLDFAGETLKGIISEGNLKGFDANSVSYNSALAASIGVNSGKWYCEATSITQYNRFGIAYNLPNANIITSGVAYYGVNGVVYKDNVSQGTFATYTNNDVIGMALDADAKTIAFYKNGTLITTVSYTSTNTVYFCFWFQNNVGSGVYANFGQRPFAQTPPSGFKALNTYNLPEPTIPRGDKYFKQYLYTGNGGGQQIGEIQKPASLFNLDRSLRFRSSNSAYLSRTPASAATLGTKFTWSGWVKRGTLGTTQALVSADAGAGTSQALYFETDNTLKFATGATNNRTSTTIFRDPLIWNHIFIAADSTTTGANRLVLYVNGIQQTWTGTDPTLNVIWQIGKQSTLQGVGFAVGSVASTYFDGYLADVYFVDGQALTPTSFGAYDGNNYWTPKAYTGTYGTNGFHLEFEDFSNNTATTIGKDTSGQSNNWTPTGINLTTPANTNASWDSMVDVPTQTSTDVAGFATLNPLTGSNIGSGNLQVTGSGAGDSHTSTIPLPTSGKWYAEMSSTAYNASTIVGWFGVSNRSGTNFSGLLSRVLGAGPGYFSNDVLISGTNIGALNDVFGIAVDMDALTVRIYINGVLQATTCPIVAGVEMYFYYGTYTSGTGWVNFGQRPFKYSNYGVDRPAATFKTLNTFNVAEVIGDVESPDLVRIKSRSATTAALWFNSVSGTGKHIVGNNSTAGEVTDPNSIIQFNKNGLLIGNNANINTSAATYIADVWKAGETTQNITVGQYATSPANIPSIASTVRANPISGISVVSYTGNATAGATVGHGLNSAPSLIIVKNKATTSSWAVYHKSLGATNWLMLNSTLGQQNNAQEWNNTAPTSTVFTVGNASSNSNQASSTTAFCFSEIPGFSKFDRYLSNGSSTDGPFVYTGFRPRWVMIKQADATRSWIMYDTTRNTYNVVDKYFFMEGLNNNEQTAALLDINSNGFKLKNNNLNTNTTAGSVYIYMAFAENPFKYALAR